MSSACSFMRICTKKEQNRSSSIHLCLQNVLRIVGDKLKDASPFQDQVVEEKYHEFFLRSLICLGNLGSSLTMGISTVYHIGVLVVRYRGRGITNFDDYLFAIRLAIMLMLWVGLLLSSRMSEKQRYRIAVFVRKVVFVRFFVFMGELVLMDLNFERAKLTSFLLTLSFVLTSDSYQEHIFYTGVLAYAGHFARIVIQRNPQPWTAEIENILFSTFQYFFCMVLFAVSQINSRARFLRSYSQGQSYSASKSR
ncbi:hypothetical protein GUITHDRAFT_147514 [Guillardia theta CCMP2712]|uniref:Uncharacterized protein n=2 Tax=Guillardia theta TaxID=55529 RepID=L1IDK9_GUITC|nr:hypothetical protein GUITHDRAFT_147514 [Guillardia theta CCMP2712]EKX33999.1 hypothetical protein GUITHDRAFT_147514 [Guillardia theta CCMP2712]|mmetsp:Transcript_1587/g.4797  ORF Transcript_1587/g.4797 Transcript_1587/m.4797 type:complete len:252 (+) Transcript_1587:243-998(+)|eukprot:XP_005820979.1 hypothetical protein GUITHDRAFT_147514 [Guillardia theta CCMP2712]